MISEKTIDKCYEAANEFFVKHEKQTEVGYLIDGVTVIAKRTGSNVKMHIFSQFNARFKYGTWEFNIQGFEMYKTQQSYDEMNDDFIQFDSDMSHVDLDDLFDLADSITVPEPHIINEMWSDDDKYNWQDVANCLRDNWHEIKGLVSLTDRDKMSDFAFDNHFE